MSNTILTITDYVILLRVKTGITHNKSLTIKSKVIIMSEVLFVPDNNSRNNNSTLDAAALMSMMNNGGGFGNGNWMWIVFLFFLEPLMRNGMFGNGGFGGLGGTNNLIENAAGREMLMQAIGGNTSAIQNLANMFGTSTDFIKQAICGLDKSVATVSGQVGLTGQQVINAVQMGNMQIGSQLASCCCDIRESVTKGNYDNQIATLNQTNTLQNGQNFINRSIERGFADTAYAFRDQTCQIGGAIKDSTQVIKDGATANTQAILAKLDNMERTGLLDKIDAQRETISQLRTQRDITLQNIATQQMIGSALAPINAQLAKIECAQPNTVTVPYYPFQVTPLNGINPYGTSNGCGCGCQNQFWY